MSSTETMSIVLKNPGLSCLPLHSGMPLRGVLPLILKIMYVDVMKVGLIISKASRRLRGTGDETFRMPRSVCSGSTTCSNKGLRMEKRPLRRLNHPMQISNHSRQTKVVESLKIDFKSLKLEQLLAFLAITPLRPCLSPISTSNQAFFERGDMGVAEDVCSEYMVPLPILG